MGVTAHMWFAATMSWCTVRASACVCINQSTIMSTQMHTSAYNVAVSHHHGNKSVSRLDLPTHTRHDIQ